MTASAVLASTNTHLSVPQHLVGISAVVISLDVRPEFLWDLKQDLCPVRFWRLDMSTVKDAWVSFQELVQVPINVQSTPDLRYVAQTKCPQPRTLHPPVDAECWAVYFTYRLFGQGCLPSDT